MKQKLNERERKLIGSIQHSNKENKRDEAEIKGKGKKGKWLYRNSARWSHSTSYVYQFPPQRQPPRLQ